MKTKSVWLVTLGLAVVAGAAAQNGTSQSCHGVLLNFTLQGDHSLEQRINDELVLRFQNHRDGSGWDITLEDRERNDYIYPVNPPLRFNASQILGRGYDYTARQSLQHNRELRFLLSRADYDFIHPLLTSALWPYSAPKPDKAADEYVTALSRLRTGVMRLKMVDSDVSANDVVRWAKVQVEMIAPADFVFAPELKAHTAACPPQWKF